MTFLVERLNELRGHATHAREIAPRITDRSVLEVDRSLRNDVLFSLLMIAQLVIDIASELAARRGDRFEDYREAIHTLGRDPRFPPDLVTALERLPGFRNVVVPEYIALNLDRAVDAVRHLEPIDRFIQIVGGLREVCVQDERASTPRPSIARSASPVRRWPATSTKSRFRDRNLNVTVSGVK